MLLRDNSDGIARRLWSEQSRFQFPAGKCVSYSASKRPGLPLMPTQIPVQWIPEEKLQSCKDDHLCPFHVEVKNKRRFFAHYYVSDTHVVFTFAWVVTCFCNRAS